MIRKLISANLALLALLLASGVVNAWTHGSIAQSILSSLSVTATNPTLGSDANYRRAVDFSVTTDNSNANPNFSDAGVLNITQNSTSGFNTNGGLTSAKSTYVPILMTANQQGAGQRISFINTVNCWGMGDCASEQKQVNYASGPVNGDEGVGFSVFSKVQQQQSLDQGTITSVTRTSCNTTATQAITASVNVQAITVASTAGCNVNDWVVIGQELANGSPNSEAVQITAVGGGTISGQFSNNHNNGVTVTPALVMGVNVTNGHLAQQRVMVNTSTASTYSTGTVSSITGGGFTGSGTTWATNMVGGGSLNIGCIALTADDYSGSPFNSTGANGTLKSWYQINLLASTTSLGIFTYSVIGDTSYRGKGPGSGGYIVRPCVSILKVLGNNTAIAESTSTTWTVGDSIEVAISPYPDITAYQYNMSQWTPGATPRGFLSVVNGGARTYQIGINLTGQMATGSNADTVPWGVAYAATKANTGLQLTNSQTQAILLDDAFGSGGGVTDNAGKIGWVGSSWSIKPNSTNLGLEFQMTTNGAGGKLAAKDPSTIGTGNVAYLQYSGLSGTTATTFSNLPTCASALEGLEMAITDGNSVTFNATVAGGGANHVKAYCNGTNWTVH